MARQYPAPLFHTIVDLPTGDSKHPLVRAVMTDQGPLTPQIEYFLSTKIRNRAESWHHACARAIGLFYDFVRAKGHEYRRKESQLLSDFVRSLLTGTIEDESDSSDLWWPHSSAPTCKDAGGYVKGFSDWCVKKYGAKSVSSTHELTWGERFARYRELDKKNDNSLLGHLKAPALLYETANSGTTPDYLSEVQTPYIVEEFGSSFPLDKFEELIFSGFTHRGTHENSPPHERYKIRDMMVAILQGAGGLRECEPFHLWIDDIFEDPNAPGHAVVRIHHPSQSVCVEHVRGVGAVRKLRSAHLQELGLLPRNKGRGNYRAGWKNPLLRKIKGTGEIFMPVFFYPFMWAEIFFLLYKIYMAKIRPHGLDHPFLFVSHNKRYYGQPWSVDSYLSSYMSACKGINLTGSLIDGSNPHALRHMYASLLDETLPGDSKHRRKIIQQCLHHKSDKSQDVYTEKSLSAIQTNMNNAHAKISNKQLPSNGLLQLGY